MRHRRTRHDVVWALAVLLPALQACYEYVPIATSTLPVGQVVEIQITDRGRVGLGDRFGPGVQEIVGRVVSEQGNDVVISVKSVTSIGGETTQWNGDTTRVDRGFAATIRERHVSTTRTVLLAVGAGVAIYVLASTKLLGAFSDTKDEPGGPPIQSTRIPVIP